MGPRLQRGLARELTPVPARLFGMEAQPDHVNIRFYPYPPTDLVVGGKLLFEVIQAIGRIIESWCRETTRAAVARDVDVAHARLEATW
jgi:hypothetical protein